MDHHRSDTKPHKMFSTIFRNPTKCLIVAWTAITLSLQIGSGTYNLFSLILLIGGAGFLLRAGSLRLAENNGEIEEIFLQTTLIITLGACLLKPLGMYMTGQWYQIIGTTLILILFVLVLLSTFNFKKLKSQGTAIFVFGLITAFGLRLLLPLASPDPTIDTFRMFQESAANLLNGKNPYTTSISDVYQDAFNFGYQITGYSYPPLNLILQTMSYAISGDIRYAYIAAEAIGSWCLYLLTRDQKKARWLVLLFLFMPRGIFVIEQAWTEPFIVAAYTLVNVFAERKKYPVATAVLYGLMLSLKQYLVFFIIQKLMIRSEFRYVSLAALTGLLTFIPFLIIDPRSVIENGILFQFSTGFRPDGLTLSSALFELTGISVNKLFSVTLGFFTCIYTMIRFRHLELDGWRWATMITLAVIFIFGSQAFCNYYYLLSIMVLITIGTNIKKYPDASRA